MMRHHNRSLTAFDRLEIGSKYASAVNNSDVDLNATVAHPWLFGCLHDYSRLNRRQHCRLQACNFYHSTLDRVVISGLVSPLQAQRTTTLSPPGTSLGPGSDFGLGVVVAGSKDASPVTYRHVTAQHSAPWGIGSPRPIHGAVWASRLWDYCFKPGRPMCITSSRMGCLISRLAAEGNPDKLPGGGESYYQPEATHAAISQSFGVWRSIAIFTFIAKYC